MLTDTKLRALKPKESVYRVADANGLCIEVRPTGARLWRYRYRFAGKASMAGLGEYPSMSLAEARAARDKARAVLKAGANPVQAARAQRAALIESSETTFRVVATELLSKRVRKLSPGSVVRERRLIEKDLAHIGEIPVADVTAPALLTALRKIEQRGAVESAHRARALASQVFRYAIATGRATNNPAHDLIGALMQPQVTHFASVTEPAEVAPMLRAIYGYQGSAVVVAALKLAALVFVRPGELRSARWADIDLESAEWRYVTSKTKTPHVVPLSSQALDILRELQPLTGRHEFVFPSVRGVRRPMSENTINAALRRLGFDSSTMTGHGFRAMARTILDEVLGFRPDFIEHQLAHAVRDPLGRAYNRTSHLSERRKMMQAWADYLDELRGGA
ncbi:integrase arm-type DNA-binding domain-containing protein [Xanthomonas campestris pv. badrii]|uniref:Integrase arm-type DNA-binding domain-containing protein n=1 Tax=Xanthomonas campestris pv. badrii TaxID=149696 RepID=A0A7Z2ZI78_XANCA|nr:integrase arm-type DNA-binding domain-containing protein [Xanthomonas campestris]QJD69061.1 integrase arm-type DNA-binding domain-containing protein [Xanthomonas campestris pv. badrii]